MTSHRLGELRTSMMGTAKDTEKRAKTAKVPAKAAPGSVGTVPTLPYLRVASMSILKS